MMPLPADPVPAARRRNACGAGVTALQMDAQANLAFGLRSVN
jgi:hypothetical protein